MYDSNNIFAKIIRGEIPSEKIYEDEVALAFNDVNPSAPAHVLVIPKKQYTSFNDFTINATPEEIGQFFKAVQKVASILGLQESGYRLIMNHGKHANQTVEHFHVHILGGKYLGPLVVGDEFHK